MADVFCEDDVVKAWNQRTQLDELISEIDKAQRYEMGAEADFDYNCEFLEYESRNGDWVSYTGIQSILMPFRGDKDSG